MFRPVFGPGFFSIINMFPRIDSDEPIAIDFETSGLEYWSPEFSVFAVSFSTDLGNWAYDIRKQPQIIAWMRDHLPGRLLIAHNAQFEYQCVRSLGMDPRASDWYCTMVNECLIYEHHFEYNLESVARVYGISSAKSEILHRIRVTMGWSSVEEVLRRLQEVPSDLVSEYVGHDAWLTYQIWLAQQSELEIQELERVSKLEMELLPVLADMSWSGVRVDIEAAQAAIPVLDEKERSISQEIKELVNCKDPSVFVNSPKQIREYFQPEQVSTFQWRLKDGTLVGPTKGNKGPSLDQHALRTIKDPAAAKILDLRKTIKLRDTFIRGHVLGSADRFGYVHTSFNQTRNDNDAGTVTGRLSSTGPALQQITKRDKANAEILRAMFLPDPNQEWICADYSQVDFRCAAHLTNDSQIIEAYAKNPDLDFHQVVSDMTGIPRNPAYAGAPNTKQINLGLTFGAGAGKLAFMMGMDYSITEKNKRMGYIPGTEAKRIFAQYHARLPAIKKFMEHAENVAKTRGYVKTAIGRRLRFDRAGRQHTAAGLLYQAYAADLHKIGLVETDRLLRSEFRNEARLLVSVHDEIGVSADPVCRERLRPNLLAAYTNFNSVNSRVRMRVPITASFSEGPNWWEASKG